MSAIHCVVRESDGKVIGLSAHSFTGALEDADEAPDVLDGIAEWFNGQRKPGDTISGVARGGYRFELRTALESLQPLAPGVVDRVAIRDAIAMAIGDSAYDCTRVWAAWRVGTMTENDFVSVAESEDRLQEIVDAVLAALSVDGRDG